MPVYEYSCFDCDEDLIIGDTYENIKKQEPFKCPVCGKDIKKRYSCNFILRGSGWSHDGYVTKGSLKHLDEE